jgi:signal peptidase I
VIAKKHSTFSTVFSAVGFVLILIGWFVFAPPAIGGQTSYIIVIGNSMEPTFYYGDLALIRTADTYEVGEIVTYKQPEIGTIFHRIIAIENGHYVLKGDNNTWEDSYKPLDSEILGKYWFFIPSAGKFFQKLRSPGNFALIVIIFAIIFIYTLSMDSKSARKRNIGKKKNMSELSDISNKPEDWLYIISTFGFVALILAFVSFTRPIETVVADNYTYTHLGYFEYSSEVPDDIYESDQLESGDPIFRQINDSVDITFSYELSSTKKANISGTYELLAIVQDTTGWEKSIVLVEPSLIQESSFTSTAILDFSAIDEVIDNFEEQTGITNKRYTLILQPQVEISGTLGGRPFEDTFTPELTFNMDEQKLTLANDPSENNEILNPTLGGTIMGSSSSPNTISILGLEINVLVARMFSIYMIGAVIIALFVFNRHFGNSIKSIDKSKRK